MTRGRDIVRDPGIVEAEQSFVVHDDVATPRLFLQLPSLFQHLLIPMEERVLGGPISLHQGVPDEQLTG